MDTATTHYLRLATAKELSLKFHEAVPVTIESLSAALCCTPRNVKFILRKLEEQGFIHWQPGRGRGHHSEMTLLRSVNEALEESFLELMGRGKMKEAIELIGSTEKNDALRERLLNSLNKQMGFHSHAESSSGQDVLRMVRSRRLAELDPAFVYTAFETYLLGQVCSTLITYDAKTGTFLPDLAHMWEYNEDQRVWIFYLRKGVRFHHGRVMTSRDVQATLERLRTVDSPFIWLYRDIERTEVVGDYCIRFYLSRPNRFFLNLLSCVSMTILPYDVDVTQQLIGTGPFRINEINETVLIISAFDAYYGIRPHLDRVDIWFVPNLGPYERHYELPGTDRLKLATDDTGSNSVDYPATGCRYMLINFRKAGIHHQLEFRQAMRIVFDPVALVRELGSNRITPANSFLPWKSAEHAWRESSLEDARELLYSSGYQGEKIILAYTVAKDQKEAEWLKQRGASIGLCIELQPFVEFPNVRETSEADLIIAEEVLEDDWQFGMINFFINKRNYFHICLSPDLQSIFYRKMENFLQQNEEQRSAMLNEAEDLLRDNCWILYGCHMNKKALLNQSLFGLHTAEFGFMDISKLWIKNQ